MQFGDHHTCRNGRIGFHKFLRGRFIRGFENCDTKCFITRLSRATSQDELTGLNRRLEIGKMPIDRRFVLYRPGFVVIKAGHEVQHVDELLWFCLLRVR